MGSLDSGQSAIDLQPQEQPAVGSTAEPAANSPRWRVDAAPGLSQLEEALPIMLERGHLPAGDQLAWFRTSMGMSELVLRHAACTHLALALGEPGASCSSSRRNARAHAAAMQQLAAQSNNVTLTLHGGLLSPAACLWQRITTLQLHNMQLDPSTSSRLLLHKLPRLHTLSLQQCRMGPSSSGRSSTAGKQHSANLRNPPVARQPGGITYLKISVRDSDSLVAINLLHQLPALQELHLSSTRFNGYYRVCDEGFQQLLAHRRLTRVSLPFMGLQRSHAATPCTWERLDFINGIDLGMLARVPLAGIQSCTVHGALVTSNWLNLQETEAAISSISRGPNVVFQSHSGNTSCGWTPAESTFCLTVDNDDSELTAKILTFTMQHLAPGTALVLHEFPVLMSSQVLASLAAAPPTLTTLCILDGKFVGPKIGGGVEAGPGILAHLPVHINHLVLGFRFLCHPLDSWLQWLKHVVPGMVVQRPLGLTILQGCVWWARQEEPIHEWLRTHTGGQVRIEFQDN